MRKGVRKCGNNFRGPPTIEHHLEGLLIQKKYFRRGDVRIVETKEKSKICTTPRIAPAMFIMVFRRCVNRKVQTVNWEAGQEGMSRQMSRRNWKRRINRELEANIAHKPWNTRKLVTCRVENANFLAPVFVHWGICGWFLFMWNILWPSSRQIKEQQLAKQIAKWISLLEIFRRTIS